MRLECGEKVYVTRGNEGCLAVYTEEGWEAYYETLMQLPKTKKKTEHLSAWRLQERLIVNLIN
ncbi:MraZ N-terminal domain containing protein [Allocoprobacillus halotolerans]|uniref:MraZ N-terminal domain containing protein n=1 Tax=Allocoprobacillus halotolerans TaxID=2944914 RepID=A0ABY5I6D3_9FIRM|nr:MraZ N-terminal domain-containing protein [Allocoprobacillus halotolerans]UTY40913.1 MraZ N-terminal domain containing protein [Allocoprobacillus halotolerans]